MCKDLNLPFNSINSNIVNCDVLLVCGNITRYNRYNVIYNFFLKLQDVENIIFVPGLNDIVFDDRKKYNYDINHMNFIYHNNKHIKNRLLESFPNINILSDSDITIEFNNMEYRFYGSPYHSNNKYKQFYISPIEYNKMIKKIKYKDFIILSNSYSKDIYGYMCYVYNDNNILKINQIKSEYPYTLEYIITNE